jgi:hypothetical protein
MYLSVGTVQVGLERSRCAPRAAGGCGMDLHPSLKQFVARWGAVQYCARGLEAAFHPGKPGQDAVSEAPRNGFRLLRCESHATAARMPAHGRNSCALESLQVCNKDRLGPCKMFGDNALDRVAGLCAPQAEALDACCAGAAEGLTVGEVRLLRNQAGPEAGRRAKSPPPRPMGPARRLQVRATGFRREVSRSPTCRPCGLRLKQAFTLFAI